MSPSHPRPPVVADERTQLLGWLDLQRALVRWKLDGLREQDEHRAVVATSPLTTPAGLVSHLRWTEHCWFQVLFSNLPPGDNPQFVDEPEDADFRVEGVPLARLLDDYEAECGRSDEVVAAAASLDDTGRNPDFAAGGATLRWVLLHMLEETARHVGHLDLVREQLDGEKGYY